ncbi:MAG: hypothetical protein ACFN4W_11190, partial [Segatella oris]
NLRASYSSGFRAPQAFDEDLHVGFVGGTRLVTRLAKEKNKDAILVLSFGTTYKDSRAKTIEKTVADIQTFLFASELEFIACRDANV